MRSFNPRTSIFAGMSTAALQQALCNAQQAYIELSSGSKAVTVSYTQGDGSKAVTYTAASIQNLVVLIKELQAQLGIVRHGRSPIRFVFR
jgi:hypothetical protein